MSVPSSDEKPKSLDQPYSPEFQRKVFAELVRLEMDVVCPSLGRIPLDLVVEAVRAEIGTAIIDEPSLHAALRAIARRNDISIRPLGSDPALT